MKRKAEKEKEREEEEKARKIREEVHKYCGLCEAVAENISRCTRCTQTGLHRCLSLCVDCQPGLFLRFVCADTECGEILLVSRYQYCKFRIPEAPDCKITPALLSFTPDAVALPCSHREFVLLPYDDDEGEEEEKNKSGEDSNEEEEAEAEAEAGAHEEQKSEDEEGRASLPTNTKRQLPQQTNETVTKRRKTD
jgi:hypothetical protein